MKSGSEPTSSGARSWRERVLQSRVGTLIVLAVTAALVLVGVVVVDHANGGTGLTAVHLTGAASGPAPVIGKPAPDFTATTIDGTRVSLSSLRGHAVWLTFGASWCAECRAETPDIQATYQQFQARGVVVVAIYISEDAGAVRGFAQRLGLSYLKIADPETAIASQFRVLGIPSHFFIDKTGVIRSTATGSMSRAQMTAALSGLLK